MHLINDLCVACGGPGLDCMLRCRMNKDRYAWCFSHGTMHFFRAGKDPWCTAFWVYVTGETEIEALINKADTYGDAQFDHHIRDWRIRYRMNEQWSIVRNLRLAGEFFDSEIMPGMEAVGMPRPGWESLRRSHGTGCLSNQEAMSQLEEWERERIATGK